MLRIGLTLLLLLGNPITPMAQSTIGKDAASVWQVPDLQSVPDDSSARYGRDLIAHTSSLIGPDAADTSKRFAGNGLDCESCHLNAGTQKFGLPFVGIWAAYPAFSARLGRSQTMVDRINDCMQRSMNGRPLPEDGAEMAAILAYMKFLGTDTPADRLPDGRGAPALPLPSRAADPIRGATVFRTLCAACHKQNGQGVRYSTVDRSIRKKRYLFPPVWGPDSYNDAAGMARNITAAWFVHANMPRGITFAYPMVPANDTYDVVAYINQMPRPHKAGLEKDYPDLWLKPADAGYGPYIGKFSPLQHKLGPWPPITEWQKYHAPKGQAEPTGTAAGEGFLSSR